MASSTRTAISRRAVSVSVYTVNGTHVGVNICEDIWYATGPAVVQRAAGAEVIVNINGSPFHAGKRAFREKMLATRAADNGLFVAYVNLVGGQDELVFDGGSLIFDPDGEVVSEAVHSSRSSFSLRTSTSRPSFALACATRAHARSAEQTSRTSASPSIYSCHRILGGTLGQAVRFLSKVSIYTDLPTKPTDPAILSMLHETTLGKFTPL